jgi:hypothetical protein
MAMQMVVTFRILVPLGLGTILAGGILDLLVANEMMNL